MKYSLIFFVKFFFISIEIIFIVWIIVTASSNYIKKMYHDLDGFIVRSFRLLSLIRFYVASEII